MELNKRTGQRGVTLVELSMVVVAGLILTAATLPALTSLTQGFRISSDTRAISAQLNLARMRAAADFTHARVYVNLTGSTYHLEIWNKASTCWQTIGDTNACTQASSPVIPMASGDTFGFGSIATGPLVAPAQAPACISGVAGPSPGSTTANTACVEYNSRGYPVNSSNTIVASDAIYMANNSKFYYAITVAISGQPSGYRYTGSAWSQF
jgi:prepilin-type N-terminal cleavage/methylation domain-containing protein